MVMGIFGVVKVWPTAHTFNQLFDFISRDRQYRRHDAVACRGGGHGPRAQALEGAPGQLVEANFKRKFG